MVTSRTWANPTFGVCALVACGRGSFRVFVPGAPVSLLLRRSLLCGVALVAFWPCCPLPFEQVQFYSNWHGFHGNPACLRNFRILLVKNGPLENRPKIDPL